MTTSLLVAPLVPVRRSLVAVLALTLLVVSGCDTGTTEPPPPSPTEPLTEEVSTITSGSSWSLPQFAPDGQSVFYVDTDASNSGSSSLRVTNLVGTQIGQTQLTGGSLPEGLIMGLAITSDAQTVGYSITFTQDGQSEWVVVIAKRDGSQSLVVLRSGEGPAGDLTQLDPVAFSRDGTKLVLSGLNKDEGLFETWVYTAAGNTIERIGGTTSTKPLFFAPSGDLVVQRGEEGGALYLIATDGSNARAVASGGTILPPAFQSVFSTDDRLLFGRINSLVGAGQTTLYTVPYGGGDEVEILAGDGYKAPAALTSDGTRALYTLEIDTGAGIAISPYIVETTGSATPRLLVEGFTEARAIAFSANGRRVLFSSNPGGIQTLHVATLP